jgi:hypothetical protein
MDNRRDTSSVFKRGRAGGAALVATLCVVVLLTGVAFRALSGHHIVFTSLVYAPPEKIRYPGSRTPEDTVTSFYLSVDRGDYETAFDLVLEAKWTEKPASYREAVVIEDAVFFGWTGKQEFLERMRYEIGPGGSGIKLNSVNAEVIRVLDAGPYARAFDVKGLRSAFNVHAQGSMLGACSIFSWQKELTVLQFGRKYRVFLDGGKDENSLYYQSWFAEIEKIGDLRAGFAGDAETEPEASSSLQTRPVHYGGAASENRDDRNIPTPCPCGGGS